MLVSALVLGLLGSFHCVGMCGPIAFMLPVDRTNSYSKVFQIALYHLGRLISYSLIGLVFGLLGKGIYIFGYQQQLSIIIGIVMIIAVLIPYNTISKFNFSKPLFRFISKIKSALGKELKKKSPDTFLTIGFLNGFLPCGLVYLAVFAAIASGSMVDGLLYMLAFGIGTIPLMTLTIYISRFLSGKVRNYIQRIIPIFVVIIGILFILRGLGLGIPYISPAPATETATGEIECH
ncbi:MAG: sulfite exporter TauE/SafE family protein [Flavobacteriaceae bacterium]|nr:sulfite exporter TauE/SafE family protein [Flavobacteriaceae bacterium]